MVHIPTRCLLSIACLSLPLLAAANPEPPSESPAADTELICPSDNAAECYPRIFYPTEEFQIIKEGQEIPSGLHVRMNIYTGLKEARLNIPMEGEDDTEAHEIPLDQAVVIVEQPESEAEASEEKPALRDQVPIPPPTYDNAGKIPPPLPVDGDEMGTFQTAMLVVKMEARGFDKGLDDLAELSHDLYYGVEIAKDGPVLEKLICLTLGKGSERIPADEKNRGHKAASILGSSIQNNPTALKEISNFWRLVMYPTCAGELMQGNPQAKLTKQNFVSTLRSRLGREKDPATLKAKVGAISGLLKLPLIRRDFMETSGMELLLAIFLKKGEQFDPVRTKVAQLVMDNFLDESMGAELGIWPKKPVSENKICESKGRMLEDGCWEYHVDQFLKREPDQQWAQDFRRALQEQRSRWGDSIQDREL